MISLLLFFVLLVAFWAYWRDIVIEPVVIYTLWLAIYPLAALIYYDYLGNPLEGITPYFNDFEIRGFGFLSIAAIFGLLLSMLVFYRKPLSPERFVRVNEVKGKLFLFLSFVFFGLYISLVLYNKALYFDSYVYQELRVSGFDSKITNIINIVTLIETLFLVSVQSFLVLNLKIKSAKKIIFWIVLIGWFYLLIKLATGSRIMFVIFVVSVVFWLRARSGMSGYRNLTVVGAIFLIGLLVSFNVARNPSNGAIEAMADFGKEFVFASISGLYSFGYAAKPTTPDVFDVLRDSLVSVIPSFLLGGGAEKSKMLNYEVWKESIGGYTEISPIGGYYLPGQIYLFSHSCMAVFLFFFLYGFVLIKANRCLVADVIWWKKLCYMQVITFGVVFGMRTELWVLLKMYLQQFFFVSFFLYFFYRMLFLVAGRSNSRSTDAVGATMRLSGGN